MKLNLHTYIYTHTLVYVYALCCVWLLLTNYSHLISIYHIFSSINIHWSRILAFKVCKYLTYTHSLHSMYYLTDEKESPPILL